MPIVGAITGGLDFSNYYTGLSSAVTASSLIEAKKQGAVLAWGNFLTVSVNFMIIAFILFLIVRALNTMKKKEEADAAPAPAPVRSEILLEEIRDLMARKV